MGSYLDKLLLGIKQVWRNGTPMPQRPVLNLIGFTAVIDNPSEGATDVYGSSTGGSGGGGISIVENAGAAMPFEPALNFVGFALTDEPGSTRTTVTAIPSPALIVQSNGGPITQRAAIDLVGMAYADDAGGNRMIFAPPTIPSNMGTVVTVAAGATPTLANLRRQSLIITSSGAQPVITMPPGPGDQDIVSYTCVGSNNNNGVAFVPSAGQSISDLANPGQFSSVISITRGVGFTGGFYWHLATTQWVSF